MAAAVAAPALAGPESASFLSSEQQLGDLVKQLTTLRNDIVAGSHPRLKIPARVGDQGRPLSAVGQMNASSLPGLSKGLSTPVPSSGTALPQAPPMTTYYPPANGPKLSSQHGSTLPAAKSGLDPIFLEKSATLVKAEAQVKRDRLEHILEEQAQMKRNSMKHKPHDEFAMPDFSVDDVLQSAQKLVQPIFARREGVTAGGASSADSFDENTFYSSQMNESTSTEGEVIEESKRPARPKLCRFYLNDKRCPYGDKCQFSHDPAMRARVDGPHVRDGEGTNLREEESLRTKSPRFAPSKGRDGKNDQPAAAEPTSQQQRIAQLEAQLEAMKAKEAQLHQNHQQSVPTAQPRKAQHFRGGPDEFGRDASLRDDNAQQNDKTQQQELHTEPRADREYDTLDSNHTFSYTGDVQVIRNHITSPYAPQPARVSPLAVAKVPQVNSNQGDSHRTTRIPHAEVLSDGSPIVSAQPLNSKKRRRGRDSVDQHRNVAPRRETSPPLRIKEEPISPPPARLVQPRHLSGEEVARPLYVDTPPRPQDRGVDQNRVSDQPGNLYEANPPIPVIRRVVKRNGQYYFADEDPELKRVVSDQPMKARPSPTPHYNSSPHMQPRIIRPPSQARISPPNQGSHVEYRNSIHPQSGTHVGTPSPISRQMSPVRTSTSIMAPPPRRVVTDQYGNRFFEPEVRQASATPSRREPVFVHYDIQDELLLEEQYKSAKPRVEPRRIQFIQRPAFVDENRPVVRPTSPIFMDYSLSIPGAPRAPPREEPRAREYPNPRVVYQESRPEPMYESSSAQPERVYQVQSSRHPDEHYDRSSRFSSVQPRMVQLNDRQPRSPLVNRPVSVQPHDGYGRPESLREHYHYAPPAEQGGGYYRRR